MSLASPKPAPAAAGRFVCVVGPSGAGKDTLIDLAKAALAGDPRFVFPRRLITRPPGAGEDHEPISEAGFEQGLRENAFALTWRAHGLGYGVPMEAARSAAEGRVVVLNLSRAAVGEARRRFETSVVLVTAPREVLAARIRARGREADHEVGKRLAREVGLSENRDCELVIDNVGAPEAGAERLVAFLRGLA